MNERTKMIDVTRKVRRTDDHSVTGDVFDSGKECDCPLIVVHDELAELDGVTFPQHASVTRDGRYLPTHPQQWENVPEVRTVEAWLVVWTDGSFSVFDRLDVARESAQNSVVRTPFGISKVSVPIEKGEGL